MSSRQSSVEQSEPGPSELPGDLAQARALANGPDIVLVAGSIKGAMKAAGAASRDLWFVPRAQIQVIQDFNVRIDGPGLDAHIRWLAESMKSEGFKSEHPLAGYVARDGESSVIYITDGHCRLRASDLAVSEGAEIELLPMVISTKAKSLEDITVGLGRSASGRPLEALEKAALCKRLSNWGWQESRIAERMGMTQTYVRDLLTLIGAPVEVRELVAQDRLSASAALQAMATHGNKVVERLNEGLAKAKALGKDRMTPRHMSDPAAKVVAKEGPKLYSVVQELRSDPGYDQLSDSIKKKLDEMLDEIQRKRIKAVRRSQVHLEGQPTTAAVDASQEEPSPLKLKTDSETPEANLVVRHEAPKGIATPVESAPNLQLAALPDTPDEQVTPMNPDQKESVLGATGAGAASTGFDMDTDFLEEHLQHPHWELLPEDLDRLVQQVPMESQRCERTTILSWIYLLNGVVTFAAVSDRITGIENITLRKRTLRRVLRGMERYNLLSIVNFPDEDQQMDEGEEVIGRNSMISMTRTGMSWMRRAWNARAKLARTTSFAIAHSTLTEEEDEGKGNDPCWVDHITGSDPEIVKSNIRTMRRTGPPITSVFDLGLPKKR